MDRANNKNRSPQQQHPQPRQMTDKQRAFLDYEKAMRAKHHRMMLAEAYLQQSQSKTQPDQFYRCERCGI